MPNQGWWQRSSLTESETERRLSLSLLSRADSALAQARCGRVAEAEAAPDGAAMLGVGANKLKAGLTAACARFTPDCARRKSAAASPAASVTVIV